MNTAAPKQNRGLDIEAATFDNSEGGRGNWSEMFLGGKYFPLNPRPSEVQIEDIAQSLGQQCRYNGMCQFFYSVAEHSILISRMAESAGMDIDRQLWGLLHDGSEAYVGDVVRPIRPYMGRHLEIEERSQKAIAQRFQLSWPIPVEIKQLDNLILVAEREQVMLKTPWDWNIPDLPAPDIQIQGLMPNIAPGAFMMRWRELDARRYDA